MRHRSRRNPPQPTLPWPGTDEICPRCHGAKQVYHRATPPGVEILGGKRISCPVCQGTGTVHAPLARSGLDLPSKVADGEATGD